MTSSDAIKEPPGGIDKKLDYQESPWIECTITSLINSLQLEYKMNTVKQSKVHQTLRKIQSHLIICQYTTIIRRKSLVIIVIVHQRKDKEEVCTYPKNA